MGRVFSAFICVDSWARNRLVRDASHQRNFVLVVWEAAVISRPLPKCPQADQQRENSINSGGDLRGEQPMRKCHDLKLHISKKQLSDTLRKDK